MKKAAQYIILGTLALCATSCRPTSDDLTSYGQNDYLAFLASDYRFGEEFKAFWMAMNENYGIWDYEAANGVDWDEVYDTYLPQFEALDDTARHAKVTDEELKALYSQFIDSLHDGHLHIQIKNLHTGKYIDLDPGVARNERERGEVFKTEKENITNIDYYSQLPEEDRYSASFSDGTDSRTIISEVIDTVCTRLIRGAEAYRAAVDNAGGPTELNDSIYANMNALIQDAQELKASISKSLDNKNKIKALVEDYNDFCLYYSMAASQLRVSTPAIDGLATDGLKMIRFALFNGNIAYLRFGGFALSSYLKKPAEGDTTTLAYAYHQAVNRVWNEWFNIIQIMHANQNLGGVIIDVRNNGGGSLGDYPYVLGALLPSGGYNSHYVRTKEGTGRLDFSPVLPFYVSTLSTEHAAINDRPIVVLANSCSVSMSELTTWGVKSQPNGYVIGTRTWGGLSALNDSPDMYSTTYSGGFGERGVTPFYGYVPRYVSLFGKDRQILEGIGITPNKEVPFDVDYWKTQKRDNQLEAALDYIHAQ